jgi:ribosomal protein S18 acetylase RimI-like enzyme
MIRVIMTHTPLFFSQTDAARSELAEVRLVSQCASTLMHLHPNDGVFITPIAGGVAAYAGEQCPFNKVAGLGFAGDVEESQLEEIENAFAAVSSPVQVELSCLADPAVGAMLTRRGYQLVNFENVLGCRLPTQTTTPRAPSQGDSITIAESGDEDLEEWMNLIITGFLAPDTQGVQSHESFPREILERTIRGMTSIEGFARFIASRGDQHAGAGSMRITDGIAQFCGAATLPEHRRQGIQSRLLSHRLIAAGRAGCDLAIMTTQPGSKSQENVQKHGLELIYTRAILVKEVKTV